MKEMSTRTARKTLAAAIAEVTAGQREVVVVDEDYLRIHGDPSAKKPEGVIQGNSFSNIYLNEEPTRLNRQQRRNKARLERRKKK